MPCYHTIAYHYYGAASWRSIYLQHRLLPRMVKCEMRWLDDLELVLLLEGGKHKKDYWSTPDGPRYGSWECYVAAMCTLRTASAILRYSTYPTDYSIRSTAFSAKVRSTNYLAACLIALSIGVGLVQFGGYQNTAPHIFLTFRNWCVKKYFSSLHLALTTPAYPNVFVHHTKPGAPPPYIVSLNQNQGRDCGPVPSVARPSLASPTTAAPTWATVLAHPQKPFEVSMARLRGGHEDRHVGIGHCLYHYLTVQRLVASVLTIPDRLVQHDHYTLTISSCH